MLAIVRVRGRTGVSPDVKYTLNLLRLTRVNHCIVANESKSLLGMLVKCKDWITWGPISKGMLRALVEKRGRLPGNKKIPEHLIDDIVAALERGERTQMKPVFRLHPPRKGWKGIKQRYPRGALGPRPSMDELIKRMI